MLYTARSKPKSGNFELWSWLFMRVSGIALLVMVLIHLAINHVFISITDVTFSLVASRWAIPAWRWYDLVLLSLALVHGMNGVRIVSDDYVHSRWWRLVTATAIYTITFVFLVVGAQIILSFSPVTVSQ